MHICRYTAPRKNRDTSLVDLTRTYTIKCDTHCCTIRSAFIAQSLRHKICNHTSNTWWRRYVQHAQNCSGSFLCITKKMTNGNSASDISSILTGWTSSTHSVCSCLSSRHISQLVISIHSVLCACVRARSAQTQGTVTVQHSQWPLLHHSSIWFQHVQKRRQELPVREPDGWYEQIHFKTSTEYWPWPTARALMYRQWTVFCLCYWTVPATFLSVTDAQLWWQQHTWMLLSVPSCIFKNCNYSHAFCIHLRTQQLGHFDFYHLNNRWQ